MNCLPVIDMEMRSASRRKWTFTLRLLFALAGASACLVVLMLPRLSARERGQTMLIILSYLSLGFCLTVGGFLTADCVSSEKREGTLGLLFLTSLTGTDIVLGKMVCHVTQMFYGLCAAFPVFFLPLLAGGVTWGEVSRVVLALGLALLLASSVGVLVSVFAWEARQAMLATLSSVVLIGAVPMIYWMVRRVFLAGPGPASGVPQLSPIFTVFSAFDSSFRTPSGPALYWGSAVAVLMLSLLAVLAAGVLLGGVFRRMGSNQGSKNSRRVPRSEVNRLERNPYEWLLMRNGEQGRSFGLLMHICIGLFVLMLLASLITSHWQEGFTAAFFTALVVHLLAKLRFAVETTRQINADHSQGTLELLLVTTLPQASILQGHHNALRQLARKPLVLLISLNLVLELSVIVFSNPLHMDQQTTTIFSSLFIGGIVLALADFSTLRWLGLMHGLKASTHVKAVMRAYGTTMLVSWIGMGLVMSIVFSTNPKANEFAVVLWVWIGASVLYDWLLVRSAGLKLQWGLRRLASEGF